MAICLVICRVVAGFSGVAATDMIAIIAINFAAIGLMFKTGEFANDIVGA